MKKAILLLLTVLLAALILPAAAETPEMWTLWTLDAQYRAECIGCAVADSENTMLTVSTITDGLPRGTTLIAQAYDGRYAVIGDVEPDGLLAHMTLRDQSAELKPVSQGALMPAMMTDAAYVTEDREVSVACELGGAKTVLDKACLLMRCEDEGIPCGSAVYTADGTVRGLVAARWNEGEYRYLVVPVTDIADVSAFATRAEGLLDIGYDISGNVLRISWDTENVSSASIFVQDMVNRFYIGTPNLTLGETRMLGIPGHTYAVWVFEGNLTELPDSMPSAIIEMPIGADYDSHRFQTVDQYIGLMPDSIGEYTADLSQRLEKVTVQSLMTKGFRPVWQIVNTYETDERIDMSMMICLTFPDGTAIAASQYGNYFCMMNSIQENDVWNASLDGALEAYMRVYGTIPTGTYRLDCYFNECPAITYSFEVTE